MRILSPVLLTASLYFCSVSGFAQVSPCDLNSDGVVNVIDVQLAVDMIQGIGTLMCAFPAGGSGFCDANVVFLIINSALGATCHYTQVSWTASTSGNIVGYNIYRGITMGGPYPTKLTASPVAALEFTDVSVAPGTTYYYVATAVSSTGAESAYSNPVTATTTSP
jgi:hypothetical protein